MNTGALFARWNALPVSGRRLLASLACLFIAATIVIEIVSHPQRALLFSSALHPEQLSEVEERLAGWNVVFTPTADNVLVEPKARSSLLLRLTLAGVPHTHIDGSNEIFGKLGALTPQQVIDAQSLDALAGDIELALRGVASVQDAHVIIAPAKAQTFADQTSHEATASVRLRIVPGATLPAEAIEGIRSFVAASVPGLSPSRVTILDDRGIALGETAVAGGAEDLQTSLQSALDAALGSGISIVRVRVEYDRRAVASSDVTRSPAGALAITSQTQRERYDGTGKRYDRSDQQLDRGTKTHEVTSSFSGSRIARITAAVFLDALRPVDIYQVKSLAAATLGIDLKRGDVLDVETLPFIHQRAARKDVWWLAYGALVPALPALIIALTAFFALRLTARPLQTFAKVFAQRTTRRRVALSSEATTPQRVHGALVHEPPHAAAAVISALPAQTAAAVLELFPQSERDLILRRMQRPHSPLVADLENFVGIPNA